MFGYTLVSGDVLTRLVHAHDKHWGVRRRSRDHHFLGAALEVRRGLFYAGEHTCRLHHVLST